MLNMKASLIVLFALVVFAAAEPDDVPSHSLHKRQIMKPQTIFVKPPPGCIFYECIGNCRQRGYKSGGYCTINGCVCLR